MSTREHKTLSTAQTIALTMRVALEHHDGGRLQEAAALYREVLGIDPAHAKALFLLGLIEDLTGNPQTAVELLRAAVCAQPTATHMQRALAAALLRAGRAGAALHFYWGILSLEPGNPIAYVDLGDVLAALKGKGGNDNEAASCYQRALLLDANCASAHLGLGHIHLRAGDVPGAEAAYRAAISVEGPPVAAQAALRALQAAAKR